MKSKLTVFVIWCLMSLTAYGQEQHIPYLQDNINIDGQLNEGVWAQVPTLSGFHNFYPDDVGMAKNDTEVKIFHNGKYLYISAIYKDTTAQSRVSSLKRDDFGGIILSSDNFQVVIDTYNKKSNGYFFSVNASNAQLDGLVSFGDADYNMNKSWHTIWQSKTKTQGHHKVYEIAIPLKSLNFDPQNNQWAFNFVIRDSKANNWMSWTDMSRNYFQHDLRNTKTFTIDHLPKRSASKFVAIPSLSYNYAKDIEGETDKSTFKPSLDAQYSLTSSLKLDVTINPDFSQIDVDQQVTNLTRFAINFPEQRNFFVENSDLFANLGTNEVNPFYSRRIGATNDILFGVKLSGNLAAKTRIGVLNVQTNNKGDDQAQNYGALVLQQQLSPQFTTTGFIVNKQATDDFEWVNTYNRVAGLNLNYRSVDNKWTGLANVGQSYSNGLKTQNGFYNLAMDYSTKKIRGSVSLSHTSENYITAIGFTPRLYNYDALNDVTIREGYTRSNAEVQYYSFPKSKKIQTIRSFPSNTIYFDAAGQVSQSLSFYNQAFWFENSSSAYINVNHKYVDLKYAFDPLGEGQYILPDIYNYGKVEVGYNSINTKDFSYNMDVGYGTYYDGRISSLAADATYRLLPIAKLGIAYELNHLDLKDLGSKSFHLVQFKGEIFFNNRLNWTTYLQYNTQANNLNINSRLQWEYKPLSYVYLVVSDNYNQSLDHKNWGVAFKMNYRLGF